MEVRLDMLPPETLLPTKASNLLTYARHELLLRTIKAALAAHDIEKESVHELRGLLRRIQSDVNGLQL